VEGGRREGDQFSILRNLNVLVEKGGKGGMGVVYRNVLREKTGRFPLFFQTVKKKKNRENRGRKGKGGGLVSVFCEGGRKKARLIDG